jgi:hypothetical protein
MSDIILSQEGGGLTRDVRRAAKTISRCHSVAQVRIARIDAETDVALAKVDAVSVATGSAMASVVRVAQAQRHLELLAPEAAGRLSYLADDHMLAMGDTVADLRRELRRR